MGSNGTTFGAVELVLDAHASTGESPTWSEREQALYWIDIEGPALHRFDPQTGEDRRWEMPSQIGAFALCRSGKVLAALRTGLVEISTTSGDYRLLAPPPCNPRTHRFNDGKCDAAGRFWIGTMHKPLEGAEPASGRNGVEADEEARNAHVYTRQGGLEAAGLRAVIANGLAWSPDHRTMYFTDTQAGTIHAFDFDLNSGRPSRPRVFKQFEPQAGKPDGAAVDREGHYWCALHGAGRVVRLDPDGTVEREIVLPVSQPTMCAFGGAALDTLYITSASSGLDAKAREREPHAGGLFRCKPGVQGQPAALFSDDAGA